MDAEGHLYTRLLIEHSVKGILASCQYLLSLSVSLQV